jgi:hypothetical protein
MDPRIMQSGLTREEYNRGHKLFESRKPKSYMVGVKTPGDTDWVTNALTFKTEAEAMAYGSDLNSRWTLVIAWKVIPSTKRPSHRWNPNTYRAERIAPYVKGLDY